MRKEDIDAINKYCNPDSFLVITPKGRLIRLCCPFDVVVIIEVDIYNPGDKVKVSQVKMDYDLCLVYVIKGKAYYYYNFQIQVPFMMW